MNKKLLMTASSLSHIENFHLPYIKAFHQLGWQVHVAGAGEMKNIPFADEVFCPSFEKRFFSVANLSASALLRKKMKDNGYDLIICHTSLAAFFTRLASSGIKGKSKIINVVHGYLFDDRTPVVRALILKTAEKLVANRTDLTLTMNRWDSRWAEKNKISSNYGRVQGMGLDMCRVKSESDRKALGFDDKDFLLVYPAEFSKRKNQAMLIRAMALLPERVKLILPGTGSLLNECKALALRLGVDGRVIFPGHVGDVFRLLAAADVSVSSSRSEGLPFNVLEGMASSLPVIASKVKGNEDLVVEEMNGLLYPYDDEPSFADCVKKLMDDEGARRSMGQAGKQKAEHYSLEKVLPVVMEKYLSVFDYSSGP